MTTKTDVLIYGDYKLEYNNEDKTLLISFSDNEQFPFAQITNLPVGKIEKCVELVEELGNIYGYIEGDYHSLIEDLIRVSFDFTRFKVIHNFDEIGIEDIRIFMDKVGVSDVISVDEDFNINTKEVDGIVGEIVALFTSSGLSLEDRMHLKLTEENFDELRKLLRQLHKINNLGRAYTTIDGYGCIAFSSDKNFNEAFSKTILKDWNVYLSLYDGELIICKEPIFFTYNELEYLMLK